MRLGAFVRKEQLRELGFAPFQLSFRSGDFAAGHCEWDTLGEIPDSPGLYTFVLVSPLGGSLRVAYVGLTDNLWMVTKGRLPRNQGARGPQRYGRYKHAGETRSWVNSQVTSAISAGFQVEHWLSARELPLGCLRHEV